MDSSKAYGCLPQNLLVAKLEDYQKQSPGVVLQKILQNSQENTCVRVPFLIELQVVPRFWRR